MANSTKVTIAQIEKRGGKLWLDLRIPLPTKREVRVALAVIGAVLILRAGLDPHAINSLVQLFTTALTNGR